MNFGGLAIGAVGFSLVYYAVAYAIAYLIRSLKKTAEPITVKRTTMILEKFAFILAFIGYLGLGLPFFVDHLAIRIFLFMAGLIALCSGIYLEAIKIANKFNFVLIDCKLCGNQRPALKSHVNKSAKWSLPLECAKCDIKNIVSVITGLFAGILSTIYIFGVVRSLATISKTVGIILFLASVIVIGVIAGMLVYRLLKHW